MKTKDNGILRRRKRNLAKRLEPKAWPEQRSPMLAARHIRYEMADRTRAIPCGGIGAFHALAERVGLVEAMELRCLKDRYGGLHDISLRFDGARQAFRPGGNGPVPAELDSWQHFSRLKS